MPCTLCRCWCLQGVCDPKAGGGLPAGVLPHSLHGGGGPHHASHGPRHGMCSCCVAMVMISNSFAGCSGGSPLSSLDFFH